MKFKNPMLSVKDLKKSVDFYKEILGLRVIADFGANVTLTGGVALQSEESWKEFIGKDTDIVYGDSTELYFEEDDFDAFIDGLSSKNIDYVHPALEHGWGQRVVRFYDPDKHIIEVGEILSAVCSRFASSGMDPSAIAARMEIPEAMVKRLLKDR